MPDVSHIVNSLLELKDSQVAAQSRKFFKTAPGQYGEGDVFVGIRVPVIRREVRRWRGISLEEAQALLDSEIHEVRMFAVLMMVQLFVSGDTDARQRVYASYLGRTDRINNWDLVDSSAPSIVGGWLFDRDRSPLAKLAASECLWDRRIAIVSTWAFIRKGDFADTIALSGILLNDREDLIQKAVGWMLREVGKRDRSAEEEFLNRYAHVMPRTMLRYAIEKFPEPLRQRYLKA